MVCVKPVLISIDLIRISVLAFKILVMIDKYMISMVIALTVLIIPEFNQMGLAGLTHVRHGILF